MAAVATRQKAIGWGMPMPARCGRWGAASVRQRTRARAEKFSRAPTWNYVVLAVAAVFEGFSWHVSRRELERLKRPGENLWRTVQLSKDASLFTVFVEDSAALVGIAIAALGIWLSHTFDNRYFDPVASVLIGLVLIGASVLLARESGRLLVGESIVPRRLGMCVNVQTP
jgi:divalent metal cation (Fe/Co/Zn/Cd) transporter